VFEQKRMTLMRKSNKKINGLWRLFDVLEKKFTSCHFLAGHLDNFSGMQPGANA
jgi:hypothetical protein